MKRALIIALAAATVFAGVAQAQQRSESRQKEQVQRAPQTQQAQRAQQGQQQRMERMQSSLRHMEGIQTRVREMNQRMERQGTEDGIRELGRHMEQTGEQVQLMLRRMDQLCQDPAMQRDQDRLRHMDRLHDRLRTMAREIEQAHFALARVAGI